MIGYIYQSYGYYSLSVIPMTYSMITVKLRLIKYNELINVSESAITAIPISYI